jgi:predicted alpha/beta hydrolase family esterase
MKKRQIILIHGGAAYGSYKEYLKSLKSDPIDESALGRRDKKGWKDTLGQKLGRGYDVLNPEMPSRMNAKYLEWKIWFEKLSAFFTEPVVLIGHSLGGIFLARYLGENIVPVKVKAVFLIAAPYSRGNDAESIGDFITPASLSNISRQCANVYIYHSTDDPIVPFKGHFDRYVAALPGAHSVVFKNKKHFRQATFPELMRTIKNLWA